MMSCGSGRWMLMLLALFALPSTPSRAAGQSVPAEWFAVSGDGRISHLHTQRTERDGAVIKDESYRARIRLGSEMRFSDAVYAKVRAAGRLSSDQESFEFFVRDHVPTVDGLRFGQATFDEAYLNYRPSQRINVRAGRFQSKFALADLLGKSLDRGDSPNVDVTWTDGAHLTIGVGRGWDSHLIVQHNAAAGATNVARGPLDFSDSRSRLTYFAALENAAALGPIVQRALDLTYIPGALRPDGTATGGGEDYIALVARGAAAWPLATGRVLLGGELGYAPNTPTRQAMRFDATDHETGGIAYQIALTLADQLPDHRIGIVYGETEAGWLISPDFRENNRLVEGRYQWQFATNHSVEARIRQRRDLELLASAERERKDLDFYLRVTLRF